MHLRPSSMHSSKYCLLQVISSHHKQIGEEHLAEDSITLEMFCSCCYSPSLLKMTLETRGSEIFFSYKTGIPSFSGARWDTFSHLRVWVELLDTRGATQWLSLSRLPSQKSSVVFLKFVQKPTTDGTDTILDTVVYYAHSSFLRCYPDIFPRFDAAELGGVKDNLFFTPSPCPATKVIISFGSTRSSIVLNHCLCVEAPS